MPEEDMIMVFGEFAPEELAPPMPAEVMEVLSVDGGRMIKASHLEANMRAVVSRLNTILEPVDELKGYKVERIEIDLGVSGKGEIGIFSTGVGLEAKAGIKLVIQRK